MKRIMAFVIISLCLFSCGLPICASARTIRKVDGSDWGLTLLAEDVTPVGMTLVMVQSGGNVLGELEYGHEFYLEVYSNDNWESVPYITTSVGWTMEAFLLNQNSISKENINWERLYGELSPGRYRFCREYMDFRGADGYDYGTLYAEFTLTDLNTDQAEEEDVYRVVGNGDCLGNWDPAFDGCVLIEAAPKEYVGYLRDVPAGNYEIKITKNGSWEECWGDPLESDENYCFTVVQQQDVFVKFRIRDGQGTIHLSGDSLPPPADIPVTEEPNADTGDVSLMPVVVFLLLAASGLVLRRKTI